MVVSALLFGALAVAVRGGGDDDGESIAGPAEELPAVVGAADELLGTVPPPASIAEELGTRYGEVTVGFGELEDELDFAAEFDRLPDAEARLLGRTLGADPGPAVADRRRRRPDGRRSAGRHPVRPAPRAQHDRGHRP